MTSIIKNMVLSLLPGRSLIRTKEGNKVYLTFDDGPHPENTPKILDTLSVYNAKATFFVQGEHVLRYPTVARRIVEEGHTIAGHSWSHQRLPLLDFRSAWSEYKQTQQAIFDVTGVETTLYRPPYGWVTIPMLLYAALGSMKLVLWSVDTDDDRSRSVKVILTRTRLVSGGDIVLCHDDNSEILEALPKVLQEWRERGLEPCSVAEDKRV
jgi:peptidoglycan/xylan/chitin deacetylase (PgdA/CDA1 family)